MSSEDSSDDSLSEGSQPTPTDSDPLPQVIQWLETLDLNAMAPGSTTGSVSGGHSNGYGTKVGNPDEFAGGRNQVEPFVLQCQLVFAMDQEKWAGSHKKIMYVISYMKGPAFEFIQPYLKDYLEHLAVATERKDSTRRILNTESALFKEIRSTFGYGNEQHEAERAIQGSCQRTSAAKYKAEFQILAAKLEWNDQALAAQFYQGLKDNVKDEIARDDRPDTFQEMVETAIRIDTRIWERQLEKKGNFRLGLANTKPQRDVPEWKHDYYGLQKMQIDATNRKPGSERGPSEGSRRNDRKPVDKSQVECYGCGRKGHFKRDCRGKKPDYDFPRRQIAATMIKLLPSTQDSGKGYAPC